MPTARLTIVLTDIELDLDEVEEEDEDAVQEVLDQLQSRVQNLLLDNPKEIFELGIANVEDIELE